MPSKPVCRFYALGRCHFGQRCWRSHDTPSQSTAKDDDTNSTDSGITRNDSKHNATKKNSRRTVRGTAAVAVLKTVVVAAHMCGITTACPLFMSSLLLLRDNLIPLTARIGRTSMFRDCENRWERSCFPAARVNESHSIGFSLQVPYDIGTNGLDLWSGIMLESCQQPCSTSCCSENQTIPITTTIHGSVGHDPIMSRVSESGGAPPLDSDALAPASAEKEPGVERLCSQNKPSASHCLPNGRHCECASVKVAEHTGSLEG